MAPLQEIYRSPALPEITEDDEEEALRSDFRSFSAPG